MKMGRWFGFFADLLSRKYVDDKQILAPRQSLAVGYLVLY
jgi:hypothetical protein